MKEYFAKLKQLFRWRDLIFTVLLFAIILTIAFCKGQNLVEISFGDTAVDITGNRYSMNIPYDMVQSVTLETISKDDDVISAREDLAMRTGQWKNADWGEYYACIDLQTNVCVLVNLNDGRYFAFSAKNEDYTTQAYETLLDKVK